MAMKHIFVFVIIVVGIYGKKNDNDIGQVDDLRTKIIKEIKTLQNGGDVELIKIYNDVCDDIDKISILTTKKETEQLNLLKLWSWDIINKETNSILQSYWHVRNLQKTSISNMLQEEWLNLANSVLSGSPSRSSVLTSIENLQEMIADRLNTQKNLFQSVSKEVNSNLCSISQSPQQILYNLYLTLQLTQLKAYTMIQFSWMLLRLYNRGNFSLESNMMREKYIQRTLQQSNAAKQAIEGAKQEFWRCDPRKHIEGETYTELTKLLQGFIVNEVDLNDKMSCKEDCSAYKITKQYGCYKDNYCSQQPKCRGKIIGCQFIDSDMWVCPADYSSKRKYDWIEYESGRTIGLKKSCSRPITKVDSWWRWLFWHCSFCFCFCDDQNDKNSHRYFNLRPVTSNSKENRVVTGLRFVKSNQVIHLQIQEGVMLPRGEIDETTVVWRPVESYDVNEVKEGKDYHIITFEQRAIDLDDLLVPEGHVLTGIRFRKVGKHLNFEIQATKFNYTTGNLKGPGDRSQWISNDNTDGAPEKPRTKLFIEKPDIPTRSASLAEPDSHSDQYLEFTNTDIDSDAAQSTVPFIDIQPVAPKPPVPLAGAGIYHKGQKWFGGFIAPKVFTLDFTNYIQINMPEELTATGKITK